MRMRGTAIEISPSFFQELDEFIADNKANIESVHWATDKIIMGYAYSTVGFAQKRSAGLVDYQMKNKAAAWLIPVRRITGAYWTGWYAERLAPSVWMVSNKSREAYYIEFGINHTGTGKQSTGGKVRIRRPILKLSIMEAMAFAVGTNFDIKEIASFWRPRGGATHSPLLNPNAGIQTSTGSFFLTGAIASE